MQDTLEVTNRNIEKIFVALVDDSDFKCLAEQESKFNVFDALGTRRQELRHSDFLAYMLDPGRPHGLGDRFLRDFLKRVVPEGESKAQFSPLSLRLMTLDNVIVERERHRIDISIEDPGNWLVLIENKIDAREHGKQLEAYKEIGLANYTIDQLLLIYLTANGDAPSDDQWVAASHRVTYNVANDCSKASDIPQQTRFVLEDYADFMEGHILKDSKTAELCKRIYQKHKEAIDTIFVHLPSPRDTAIDLATSVLDELELQLIIKRDSDYNKVSRFYDAQIEDLIPDVENAGSWTRSNKGILFEWEPRADGLYLDLVIGPIQSEVREKILDGLKRLEPSLYDFTKVGPKYCHAAKTEVVAYNELDDCLDDASQEEVVSSMQSKVQGIIDRHRKNLVTVLHKI